MCNRAPVILLSFVLFGLPTGCFHDKSSSSTPDDSSAQNSDIPGTPNNTGTPGNNTNLYYASDVVAALINSTTPESAMEATSQALAAGGVALEGQLAANYPPASWQEDSRLAFNMAMEARDRATAGRYTLAQVGQMLQDFEFPFGGSGTPGEQLMSFLRLSYDDAKNNENAPGSFTPLFLAEMALHQVPPVDISDPKAEPEDLRLTMLEMELLIAAFDRAFQEPAGLPKPILHSRDIATGLCDAMKKYLGTVGSKVAGQGVDYVSGQLSDKALESLGLKSSEIAIFKGTLSKVFSALDAMMKVTKLIQIYADGHATLKIEGDNPAYKPEWGGARKLVPFRATVGVPSEEWQNYEKSMGGQQYQDVKSCLSAAGVPMPNDMKDMFENVDKWHVSWDIVKGAPKHALIPGDVNTFTHTSAGRPFTMALASAGPGSASAVLKLDILEEPQLASLFKGEYITTPVRVKAEILTAEPPSPLMLAKVTSLIGTLEALGELTVGWIQTGLPPTTTITLPVKYHPMPDAINISADVDMRYKYMHFADETPLEHTASGGLTALLEYRGEDVNKDDGFAGYRGVGAMTYLSATTRKTPDPDDDCTYSYAVKVFNGQVTGGIHPASNQNGSISKDAPFQVVMGIESADSAPREQQTMTVHCPDTYDVVVPFPTIPVIMVGALNNTNMMDDKVLLEGGKIPGLSLNSKNWSMQNDGSIQRTLNNPQTISIVLSDGVKSSSEVISQSTVLKLKPVFATKVQ